jgi:hypothetical protein
MEGPEHESLGKKEENIKITRPFKHFPSLFLFLSVFCVAGLGQSLGIKRQSRSPSKCSQISREREAVR